MRRSIETGLVLTIAAWAVWMWVSRRNEARMEAEALAQAEVRAVAGGAVETPLAMLAAVDTGFAGRVVAPAGTGAEVCAWPAEARGGPGLSLELALAIRCAAAAEDGSYRLVGLTPGAYRVVAAADGFLPVQGSGGVEPTVTVLRGELREGVDFTLMLRGEAVRGVVRDALGGAIAGAVVGSELGGHARSDAEGRFTLWAPAAVNTRVEVVAPGHASGSAVVQAPQELAISLAAEAVLRGQVVRAEGGGPLVGLAVQLEVERVAAVSEEDGSFEVRGLAAGAWRPFVRSEGWCGEATGATLAAGATSEVVTIAARRCVEAELGPVLP